MAFELQRLPQTEEELFWVVKAMWGVTIPRQVVCADHVAPMTAFADAYFGRNSINPDSPVQDMALWHGSRGLSGKSFMLAVLGLTKAVLLGSDVNLLGGSYEQSKNIHIHMRNSWDSDNAPKYMLKKDSNTEVELTNKAKIRPLTASQKTVRGPHPPFLLLDEIDEMDIDILDAALGQPLPQKNYLKQINEPYTVMCSTWQNPQGTFTEIYKRAEEQDIPKYTWCYRETSNPIDGWLTQKTIDGKKAAIPKEMWRVEYELGEPSIGNRAFDSDSIERAFSLPFEPEWDEETGLAILGSGYIFKKESRDYEEYRFEKHERDGRYVAGADWAQTQDFTVICVGRIDVKPMRLVYYARFKRLPYPVMIKKFEDAIAEYDAFAEHDGTGLGAVVHDLMDNERARKFVMSGEKRSSMLSEYVAAIENDRWVFPKVKSAYTEHKYAQVGDLYSSSQEFHLPDSVCAFGLMEHVAKRFVGPVIPLSVSKNPEFQNRIQKVLDRPVERMGEVRMVDAGAETELSLLI
jgi:hypothetical protein